jgi:putative transposase
MGMKRKMDRSLRATNLDNYNENGTIKFGKKQWVFSAQYRALKAELTELQRVLAATRKRFHGKLANEILKLGTNIKAEKLSYEAFQRTFGKSVSGTRSGYVYGDASPQSRKRWRPDNRIPCPEYETFEDMPLR